MSVGGCMENEYNIIGDIAGRFDTLQALLDKMPKSAVPLSVGDMVDRGPKSKEVIEFFMKKGKAVLGNHEHMMIDAYRRTGGLLAVGYYGPGLWVGANGGEKTLKAYYRDEDDKVTKLSVIADFFRNFYWGFGSRDPQAVSEMAKELNALCKEMIPEEHIIWLESLPKFIQEDGLIITHAPINPSIRFEKFVDIGHSMGDRGETTCIWNRGSTKRRDEFQVHGHNANRDFEWLKDSEGIYGVNLDSSRGDVLTGMHWPSKEIFTEKFSQYD